MNKKYDVNEFRKEPVTKTIKVLTDGRILLLSTLVLVAGAYSYLYPEVVVDTLVRTYYSLVG